MLLKIVIEGLIMGGLLVAFCAFGIRHGAVNMVYLYHEDVQKRCIKNGLITPERVRRNALVMRACAVPAYIVVLLVSVYAVNGARGFLPGFWQMFAILSIVNLIDRLLIDGYWVGHTRDWVIPGTEDMRPYIDGRDKRNKWLMGTVGYAICAAILAGIMALILR